jgi:hypothetical protein
MKKQALEALENVLPFNKGVPSSEGSFLWRKTIGRKGMLGFVEEGSAGGRKKKQKTKMRFEHQTYGGQEKQVVTRLLLVGYVQYNNKKRACSPLLCAFFSLALLLHSCDGCGKKNKGIRGIGVVRGNRTKRKEGYGEARPCVCVCMCVCMSASCSFR